MKKSTTKKFSSQSFSALSFSSSDSENEKLTVNSTSTPIRIENPEIEGFPSRIVSDGDLPQWKNQTITKWKERIRSIANISGYWGLGDLLHSAKKITPEGMFYKKYISWVVKEIENDPGFHFNATGDRVRVVSRLGSLSATKTNLTPENNNNTNNNNNKQQSSETETGKSHFDMAQPLLGQYLPSLIAVLELGVVVVED